FFERYERITGESFYALKPGEPGASATGGEVAALRTRFLECMDDDFNTGGAVGVLFELLSALNRFADGKKLESPDADAAAKAELRRGAQVLREQRAILGLFHAPIAKSGGGGELATRLKALAGELGVSSPGQSVEELMPQFIQARADARKAKNFA